MSVGVGLGGVVFLVQQPFGQVAHGIPQRAIADQQHGDKDEGDIPQADADGIGIDNEAAGGVAQCDESISLLKVAKQ